MIWNVGPSGTVSDSNVISRLIGTERLFIWVGDIGLVTKSEYMRVNSNSSCLTALALNNARDTDSCRKFNYLWKEEYWWWLFSPNVNYTHSILDVDHRGFVGGPYANNKDGSVRPVLFLKSNITLTGNGGSSSEDMFKIS